jgi:glycosyltransferase involved in cell wall biosynthesis
VWVPKSASCLEIDDFSGSEPSFGTPHAADAHGPAQIVAPGTGWLVPADHRQALVEAMLAAASDPQERRRRGERAHRHSRAGYGWPVIAARIAGTYDQVTDQLDRQRAAET